MLNTLRHPKLAVITAAIVYVLLGSFATTSMADTNGKKAQTPVVVMDTSMGTIKVELNPNKAPVTVKNFLSYVDSGFYNGLIFHRVIPNFMIQGGGMTESLVRKPTHKPITLESNNGLKNNTYTIAMARTSAPNSATSQFFINLKNNSNLNYSSPANPGYAVFGKVIEGQSVVDAIAQVPTMRKGAHGNVPVTPVVIKSMHLAGSKPKSAKK